MSSPKTDYCCQGTIPCCSSNKTSQSDRTSLLGGSATWTVKRSRQWWPNNRLTAPQTWWQLFNWSEVGPRTAVNTLRGLEKAAQGFVRSFLWFALAVAALIRSSSRRGQQQCGGDWPTISRPQRHQGRVSAAEAVLSTPAPRFHKKGTQRGPNFEQKGDPNDVKGDPKGDPNSIFSELFTKSEYLKIVKKPN